MKATRYVLGAVIALGLLSADTTLAQGRGRGGDKQDKDKGKPQVQVSKRANTADRQKEKVGKPDRAKAERKIERADKKVEPAYEREGAAFDRGNGVKSKNKFKRDVEFSEVRPSLRPFFTSSRAPELIMAGAVARAHARGIADDDIVFLQIGDRVHLRNRSGLELLDLDDARARNLGYWSIDQVEDGFRSGAPSFCRSGDGHPVWGRQWCLEKGFGLGGYRDLRWGRTDYPDVIFRRQVDSDRSARAVLIDVLGDVVFNRLALHAITLGFSDPLSGVWLGEPGGARVLRLDSGIYPIAEIVDLNRDQRADVMVVALRPW